MALSDNAKKNLIIGGGLLAVAGIYLWSRKAKAVAQQAAAEQPLLNNEGVVQTPTPAPVSSGTTVAPPAPGAADKTLVVQRDQSWSSIAKDSYGDWRWFPFLWDYNRTASTQFENVDRLDKGTTIKIPALPPGEDFKKAIFARADIYKNARKRSRGALPKAFTDRTPVPPVAAEPIPPVSASAATPGA